jgi:hypothetical protein
MKILFLFLSLLYATEEEGLPKDRICGHIGDEVRMTSMDEYNDRFMKIHNVLGYEFLNTDLYPHVVFYIATKRTQFQREVMPTLEEGQRYCFEGEAFYRQKFQYKYDNDDEAIFWVERLIEP